MEIRNCQNCKIDFNIESEDFSFYEKMKVPSPTFCPDCRLQRRYAWRNERALFKAVCGLCKKSILSMYSKECTFPVYCRDCWLGDGWDPFNFGVDYDFSRPFFEQFKQLLNTVPSMNLMQVRGVNSDYANGYVGARNVYLSYSVVEGEDIWYSRNVDRSRYVMDGLGVGDSERVFHTVHAADSYDIVYSQQLRSCMNSAFIFDCTNCSYCFMSANLRNQKYVFRGDQCTKEEYEQKIKEVDFGSHEILQSLVLEFEEVKRNAIHKYADILKCVNSTGDALTNMKNSLECFEAYDNEDTKWTSRAMGNKNMYDVNNMRKSELVYEYVSLGEQSHNVRFSCSLIGASTDTQYSTWASGSDLFGCVGIRNGKYCILNKQYSEAEYNELLPKIIEHMSDMPYTGNNGRVYRYGEFFPIELSPFAYNDTNTQEHFPLSEKEIRASGYVFRAPEPKGYSATKTAKDLPDHIRDVSDDILKEIIACEHAGAGCVHQCTEAFRLTADELAQYRRINLPIPRLCPNCRYYKRLEYRRPWRLWHRTCMNSVALGGQGCSNEFETPYAPERLEKVYCESCYQREVM